jgi:hypothetical protein
MKTNICKICQAELNDRTSQQNRYLHKCFLVIGNETGYSMRDIKALMKYEFGYYTEVINKKTGETLIDFDSTADLNKKQFAEFTEKVLHFANKHNIKLETPEEYFRRISDQKTAEFISESNTKLKSSQNNTGGAC